MSNSFVGWSVEIMPNIQYKYVAISEMLANETFNLNDRKG